MKYEIYSEYVPLWKMALPYQDKRNDKGHAFVVTIYACLVCTVERCNLNIVIPAAILHDIGWSGVPLRDRMAISRFDTSAEAKLKARLAHQEKGVALANKLLRKVQYQKEAIPEVLDIIAQHDTRRGFVNDNEGAMRDADKLWRYDEYGFLSDYLNGTGTILDHIVDQENNIEMKEFFCFDSSKELAHRLTSRLRERYLS